MNEIKKILTIVKNRLPEVVLITGLYTLFALAVSLSGLENPEQTDRNSTLLIIFAAMAVTLTMFLHFGFLRTICVDQDRPATPIELIKTGSRFFLRLFAFELIISSIFALFALLILSVFTGSHDVEAQQKSAPILAALAFAIPTIVLIKPALLIRAIVLVDDCRLSDAFYAMRNFKLSDRKALILLYCLPIIITIALSFIETRLSGTIAKHALIAIAACLTEFFFLITFTAAVRFIAESKVGTAQTETISED